MNTTSKLIASIPTRITRFDAASDLDKSAECILLVMGPENYRKWENIVNDSGKLIERRPLTTLPSFTDIESKWAVFGTEGGELVLMSTEQYWNSFVPASSKGH
jgi:hypothetical protein